MAVMVDQIVEGKHNYSLLDANCYRYVPKKTLTDRASELKAITKKSLNLPGKKRGKETRYFYNNARVLARIAMEWEAEQKETVVAILFRDSDGTASAGRGIWLDKYNSMLNGFSEEGFLRGVPMLPKPKSEAWILCAVKNAYQGCEALEDRSGNDNSRNSLKEELTRHLENAPSRESLSQLVRDGKVNINQIRMPSFKILRDRLEGVIK